MTATCTNADCTENGLPKSIDGLDLRPGETIVCGGCGRSVTDGPAE